MSRKIFRKTMEKLSWISFKKIKIILTEFFITWILISNNLFKIYKNSKTISTQFHNFVLYGSKKAIDSLRPIEFSALNTSGSIVYAIFLIQGSKMLTSTSSIGIKSSKVSNNLNPLLVWNNSDVLLVHMIHNVILIFMLSLKIVLI